MNDISRIFAAAAIAMAVAGIGACSEPPLITRQQAQDRIYDHLSRAEAFRLSRSFQQARYQHEQAARYRDLIRQGKTTSPEQALAAAARHRARAEDYEREGYTRFVKSALREAERYEDFALHAGGLTPAVASARAKEYRDRAAAYFRIGLRRFADHYEGQARKLEQVASTPVRPNSASKWADVPRK